MKTIDQLNERIGYLTRYANLYNGGKSCPELDQLLAQRNMLCALDQPDQTAQGETFRCTDLDRRIAAIAKS